DPDGKRAAADRAAALVGERLLRGQPHAAFAVAVEMVLALVREELDGADVAAASFQRLFDREVVALAVERSRLAAELAGRMRVGIRGQAIAIEERDPPVHRRGGREGGLDPQKICGEGAPGDGRAGGAPLPPPPA